MRSNVVIRKTRNIEVKSRLRSILKGGRSGILKRPPSKYDRPPSYNNKSMAEFNKFQANLDSANKYLRFSGVKGVKTRMAESNKDLEEPRLDSSVNFGKRKGLSGSKNYFNPQRYSRSPSKPIRRRKLLSKSLPTSEAMPRLNTTNRREKSGKKASDTPGGKFISQASMSFAGANSPLRTYTKGPYDSKNLKKAPFMPTSKKGNFFFTK
jgi:hypothetical protein